MANDDLIAQLTDFADGELTGQEWEQFRAENPAAAEEVEIARAVRGLMLELQLRGVTAPPGFEARLRQRLHGDRTLLYLIHLGFDGVGKTLLELLTALFDLLPAPRPTPA